MVDLVIKWCIIIIFIDELTCDDVNDNILKIKLLKLFKIKYIILIYLESFSFYMA